METTQEIKKKISLTLLLLDLLRKMLGIQTQIEKLQTEIMVRRIAANYKVDVDVLVAVIWAESGMNPKAINRNPGGTTDYGLCQFNDYWYKNVITPDVALNDPAEAVRTMCRAWESGRQTDWIAYQNKSYLKYLNVKTQTTT